jgi:PE-PPE domain
VLGQLGLTDPQGNITLTNLLSLLGLDLSDPLNLAGLDIPGLNVITTGPPFTLLKLLGTDLGWVPGLPNSVANEVNGTDYLPVGLSGLLGELADTVSGLNPVLGTALRALALTIPPGLDAVDLRVPVVVGFGLGAFAAGAAYEKILADLPNQPGGLNNSDSPVLGSITVLPMLLLRNPGRANGGLFARFYPLFGLAGIDTVTPETEVTHSGGIPILNTGLSLGGANLVPVKVDGTVMYDLLSDFPAWPNPFSMANSLVGAVLPTYILRGLTLDTIPQQLDSQLEGILDNPLGEPLAINLYLTVPSATLPLLEPLYLLSDVTSIMTLGTASTNPFGLLANALAPALTSLVNLGYTDVVRNPDGTYTRTLTEAGIPTSFFSFPAVNPAQVIPDIVNLLVQGFTREFVSGNPTPGAPNAITNLLNLLTGGGLGPLGDLGGLVQGILEDLNPLVTQQVSSLAANEVPPADGRLLSLSATTEPEDADDESSSDTEGSDPSQVQGDEDELVEPEEGIVDPETVDPEIVDPEIVDPETVDPEIVDPEKVEPEIVEPAEDETTEGSGPRHAKPEGEDEPAPTGAKSTTTPKHAKPDVSGPLTSVVRDVANAFAPKEVTPPSNDTDSPSDADTEAESGVDGAEDDAA